MAKNPLEGYRRLRVMLLDSNIVPVEEVPLQAGGDSLLGAA